MNVYNVFRQVLLKGIIYTILLLLPTGNFVNHFAHVQRHIRINPRSNIIGSDKTGNTRIHSSINSSFILGRLHVITFLRIKRVNQKLKKKKTSFKPFHQVPLPISLMFHTKIPGSGYQKVSIAFLTTKQSRGSVKTLPLHLLCSWLLPCSVSNKSFFFYVFSVQLSSPHQLFQCALGRTVYIS